MGWYADSGLTKPFDFSMKILEDTRIYAKFDINNYKVTYNLNSGKWSGTTPDNTWTVNDCGTTLPTPVRSGYLFEGWTDSYGNFVDKLPTSSNLGNVTYSARWIEGAEGLVIKNGSVTDYNGTATSVKVPDSFRNAPVTKIGNSAFSGATSLQSITLSENITSIGSNAFTGSNIKEVYAPSIWAGTVAKQTNASTVVVTSGDTIGESAFSGCTYLTSITLPNELTAIGDSAFNGCTGLENVTLPNGLTTIKDSAFKGCTGLESIIIPNSVISVGNSLFTGCDNLTTISMPSTCALTIVKQLDVADITITGDTIVNNAFQNYTGTFNITLADSITSIGDYAFSGCSGLTEIILPNNLQNIGDYAFEKCVNLTEIILPNSITEIGSYAFCDCVGLTSISIPDKLTYISQDTFTNCANIEEVYAPASCAGSLAKATGASVVIITSGSEIYNYEFLECVNLISIMIPSSVTLIGLRAFYKCTALEEVIFGENSRLSTIQQGAFGECSSLLSIKIPIGVTSTNYTFEECSSLKSVIFEDNSQLKSIGEYTFKDCSSLISVAFGNNSQLNSIGDYAFVNCSSLESIKIPKNVTKIGDNVFKNCCEVERITVEEGNKNFKSEGNCLIFSNNYLICGCKNSIIPSYVKGIADWAFYNCSGLKSIKIPSGVTSIGDFAFMDCNSLISIIIPRGVTTIGSNVFGGCSNITIYAEVESKPSGWNNLWNFNNRPVVWGYKGD